MHHVILARLSSTYFFFFVVSCIVGGIAGLITIFLQENAAKNNFEVVFGDKRNTKRNEDIIFDNRNANPTPNIDISYTPTSFQDSNKASPTFTKMKYPTEKEKPKVSSFPFYQSPSSISVPPSNSPLSISHFTSLKSSTPPTTISRMPAILMGTPAQIKVTTAPSSREVHFVSLLNETIRHLSPDTDLIKENTPQAKAWLQVANTLEELDKFALLTLYYSINVSIWDHQITSSLITNGCCTWKGISCNQHGLVTKLDLTYEKKLFGTLPSELALATNLEVISISGSPYSAMERPNSFLKSDIGGTIPDLWGDLLTNMRVLHLYNNKLIGSIPNSIWNHEQLQDLQLDGNQLTGAIFSIPPPLLLTEKVESANDQVMKKINVLDLSDNQLLGSFPTNAKSYWTQFPHLERLSLKGNMLHGTLPNDMGLALTNLVEFHIQKNNLRGTLPVGFLSIDRSHLKWLAACNNEFTGTLPEISFSQKDSPPPSPLEGLELQNNRFRGSLPDTYGLYFSHSLRVFDLSHNFLTGSIPLKYAELQDLVSLSLHHNQLTFGQEVCVALCYIVGHIQMDCGNKHHEDCPCCFSNCV
mmetsp:Transcript_41716/g.47405  ORF Transcript_41716/g.47405 Transcript_41716/m.47405 type:complete len:585 (-) Transcript_41716:106-1860(-)